MDGFINGISLCMIVKNEENFIKNCLDSVKSVVSEMIVVDTGSTDSTIQIAKDAGASVFETEWDGDFSKVRNLSLSKANHSWILVLDADELISSSDIKDFGNLINRKDVYGYRLNLRNYVESSNLTNAISCGGIYPEENNYPAYIPQDVVRLFRNYSKIEYRDRVHEIVEYSMIENQLKIVDTQIPIHHYGKVIAPEKLQRKMNLYIELGRQKISDDPDDIKSAIELLDQLLEAGKQGEAFELSKKYLLKFPNDIRILFIAGLAAERMSKNKIAVEYYKQVLKSDEKHLGALNNYSSLLQKFGKTKESMLLKEQAVNQYPHNSVLKYNLGNGYFDSGNYSKAEKMYLAASALEPKNLLFLYRLAEYYFMGKNYFKARDYFKNILEIDSKYRDAQMGLRDSHIRLTTIPMNEETRSYFNSSAESTGEKSPDRGKGETIGLCMITKNCESTVSDTIKSVKGLVDEVVVLDTGSADNTVAICKSLGAKVYEDEWRNDFSLARNSALGYMSSDWILVLDSDELLSSKDFGLIRTAVNSKNIDGYKLLQRNYSNNKNRRGWKKCNGEYPKEEKNWMGYTSSFIVRLFRNDSSIRFRGNVHELVEDSILENGGKIGAIDVSVHHLGYSREEGDGNRAIYLELSRQKAEERADDPNAHYELGLQYFHSDNFAGAENSLQIALNIQENDSTVSLNYTKDSSYNMLGVTQERLGKGKDARRTFERGLKVSPGSEQILTNLGIWYEERNMFKESSEMYDKALAQKPGNDAIQEHITRLNEKTKQPEATLTLCMIVKNEAENLPNCLESVAGIMDQIVIVDTGSEDATVEVAKSFGAEVYHFDWIDDFSAARNVSLEHAKKDYIIWLDGDDVLSQDQAKRLLELKLQMPKQKNRAYYLKIFNEMGGTADFTASQLRIFPNLPNLRFRRRVHEQVIFAIDEAGIETSTVDITINHLGYGRGAQEIKYERNRPLLMKELEDNPHDYEMLYFLCRNYYLNGEYEQALEWGEKALTEVQKEGKSNWYFHIKSKVAQVYLKSGSNEKALSLFKELLNENKDDPVNHYSYGQALIVTKQYESAEKYLKYFLKNKEKIATNSFPVSVPELELAAYNHLGLIYDNSGKNEEAIESYKKALALNADSERARNNLGTLYLKAGIFEDAKVELLWCLNRDSQNVSVLTNLGTIENFIGDLDAAERYYRESLKIDANSIDSLINLGNLLYRQENYSAAEPYLSNALVLQPDLNDIKLLLANIYAERGDEKRCKRVLEEFESQLDMNLAGDDAELHERYLKLGVSLEDSNRTTEAILAFDTASFFNKDYHLSRKFSGVLLLSQRRYAESLRKLEEAVKIDPMDWESFAAMGETYEGLGKIEAAELSFQTARVIKGEAAGVETLPIE